MVLEYNLWCFKAIQFISWLFTHIYWHTRACPEWAEWLQCGDCCHDLWRSVLPTRFGLKKSSTQRPLKASQTHWTSNMHTYSYTCDCSDSWPKNEHSGIIYSPLSFSKPVWLLFYFRTQEKLFSSMSRLFFCTRYCTLLWRTDFYVHVYVFYQSFKACSPKDKYLVHKFGAITDTFFWIAPQRNQAN